MPLTEQEKLERKRSRLIEKAREYQLGTYARKFVASVYQQMIRAESAAMPYGDALAVVNGELAWITREVGQCVCVTCGKVLPWKNSNATHGKLDTGHFIPSRRMSVLFAEKNAHTQCSHCNQQLGGNQGCYELWMRHVYGQETIDRLRRLKNQTVQFTREELVDMRIEYQGRLNRAIEKMGADHAC